ncbi:MAG: glycoside hydrolase family 127 protein, partial [Victivallales bacterium]|nr:glycoside hydrolase family 127 protein [Victivallales bacterium]
MKQSLFSGLLATSLLAATIAVAGDYPYRPADMTDVSIKEGFWLPRFETNRKVTVWADFHKSEETGRISNFINAGKRLKGTFKGIPFDDSDVYKIIEGAAYTLATHPDPELEKYLDDLIDNIAKAQEPDGYLYTARTIGFDYGTKDGVTNYGMMGPTRWSNCPSSHELYNVGHMYEAAVAYYNVTGKRTLLDVAIRSADLVERTFGPGPTQLKAVPGHEEIELALCKLYRTTGDIRYLNLAKHFLKQRGDGTKVGAGQQAHIPVVEQREAVGHAVRATYLYCGMADVAALAGDQAFIDAVDAIWANVVEKKLHLTGGVGARRGGEAFGDNYELPNERAYLETCAAIGNALWNQRMFLMHGDAKYIDVLERIIYNGFLSGISLTGDEFFYPNPLASKGGYARSKWFGCSCCPVNIVRFIPQIAQFTYALRENTAYVNLFVASDAKLKLDNGEIKLAQQTEYPWKGLSMITVTPAQDGQQFDLAIRIPGWAVGQPVPSDLYTQVVPGKLDDVVVLVNGEKIAITPEKGYCRINRAWKAGDAVEIRMAMPVRR